MMIGGEMEYMVNEMNIVPHIWEILSRNTKETLIEIRNTTAPLMCACMNLAGSDLGYHLLDKPEDVATTAPNVIHGQVLLSLRNGAEMEQMCASNICKNLRSKGVCAKNLLRSLFSRIWLFQERMG